MNHIKFYITFLVPYMASYDSVPMTIYLISYCKIFQQNLKVVDFKLRFKIFIRMMLIAHSSYNIICIA